MKILVPDRFDVIRLLKDDGRSQSFLANDTLLSRSDVVVKVIRKSQFNVGSASLLEKMSWFFGVRHTNLAAILDASITPKGDLYYVRDSLPASELFSVDNLTAIKTLVSAVAFLQLHDQIHGSIKPSNIFFNDGRLTLTDPCFSATDPKLCEEDIRYSAPEVLRGSARDLRNDLYSLGAVLYRVLTQRNLFEDPNLTHLRAKYAWASPVPIGNVIDIPKTVTDLVFQLLDKDGSKRTIALKSLQEVFEINLEPALQGPYIGCESLLQEVMDIVRRPPTRLQIVLLDGMPGIGKSRFVEELRIHCGLGGLRFLKCDCSVASNDKSLCESIHRLVQRIKPSNGTTQSELIQEERQRLDNDKSFFSELVNSLVQISRNVHFVLAVDNVDHADTGIANLIDQISFRAAELPITLILTQRRRVSGNKLARALQRLPDRLQQVHIPLLTQRESKRLMLYVGASGNEQQFLFGNPLFIEHHSSPNVRSRQKKALKWMLAQIPSNCQPLTDLLCIAQRPVPLETVRKLFPEMIASLDLQVANLKHIGVIEQQGNTLKIASSELASLGYSDIPRHQRREIAKKIFNLLAYTKSEANELAHYAFEAGLLRESAALYQQLADDAFNLHNYKAAAAYYARVEQSETILGPDRKLKQATCLRRIGKPFEGNLILRELLTLESVQTNPELLSAVYRRLSFSFDRTPPDERIRLSRLALECLPPKSPQLCVHHIDFADNLIRAGNLSTATTAVETARKHAKDKNDFKLVALEEANLARNMGDFKTASKILYTMSVVDSRDPRPLNDLAICHEHLGNLNRALEFQSKARDLVESAGMASRRLLMLGNLTAINMKLGHMQTAKQWVDEALKLAAQMQKKERLLDEGRFLTMYCDATLYNIYRGNYRDAFHCLSHVQQTDALPHSDRIFCDIVRCRFYISTGHPDKVRKILNTLSGMQGWKTAFFQVERSLLEASLPDIPSTGKLSLLKKALEHTRQIETLYQECEVFNQLAAVLISTNENEKALEYANSANRLAQKQGYRLLRTRALLLSGIASEKSRGKEQKLLAALQNASEMGLQELVAESAFHLGVLHLENQQIVTAREYLSRSVAIIEKLANDVPPQFRKTYEAMPWRRTAHKELERCDVVIQQQSVSNVFVGAAAPETDRYFKAAYNFALSGTSTKSVEGLLAQIERTLEASFSRGCVIVLNQSKNPLIRGVKIKLSDDQVERVRSVAMMAKNRIYFGAPDISRPKEIVAWIPLQSETYQGGIYLVCRQNEPALTEKEMELLSIIGTIGNGALRTLEGNQASAHENQQLAEFHGMVGASKAIREVYSHIEIAAKNTATVLIEGESGTGKELVAKAIHAAGQRAKEPFIAVDCGSIPESLIEAELFGAKRGSYTGALTDRAGLFEAAHRGTIFLDEISNTTPALQGKLLRVVQEREIRRIGETKDRPIDVRIIVASNRNLEELVAEGRFRKDLLYRLKVLYIKVPPLRNRREDIPMIANAFLQKLNAANKLRKYCAPGVLDHLSAQTFPGNVRELQNAVERAYFLSKGSVINEIQLEDQTLTHKDEAQLWFKDLTEGRKDFWQTIHESYKSRNITRDKVVALVDLGLRSTAGSYKTLASKFHLKRNEYRRFMDFLRRNGCLLDFRPYRQAAARQAEEQP